MYTTSEVNSLSAIEEYKIAAPEYGFEIVETGISTTADVPLAADSLLSKVDCVTNLTDNTVVASLPVILDKANKSNVPVFGSEIEPGEDRLSGSDGDLITSILASKTG